MPLISVVLASRNRPESLSRAVASLAHGDVEILVGMDDDDPSLSASKDALRDISSARIIVGQRTATVNQLYNKLAAASDGQYVMLFADDYLMDHRDWAERMVKSLHSLPNQLGVVYPQDPLYPYFATNPCLSRASIEMMGFFLPPFFPFLFGDTWWNEIGVMSGMILRSSATITPQNETINVHNYRDLRLWTDIFTKLRPMRQDIAIRMIRDVFGDSDEGNYLVATTSERADACARLHSHCTTDAWVEQWNDYGKDKYSNPHYSALKEKAENFMEAMK